MITFELFINQHICLPGYIQTTLEVTKYVRVITSDLDVHVNL